MLRLVLVTLLFGIVTGCAVVEERRVIQTRPFPEHRDHDRHERRRDWR